MSTAASEDSSQTMGVSMAKLGRLLILIVIASATLGLRAHAETTGCWIYIFGNTSPNCSWVKPFTWTSDYYDNSGNSSARCLERAREYQAYCNLSPSVGVVAAFNVGTFETVNAQYVYGPAANQTVINYGYQWTQLSTTLPDIKNAEVPAANGPSVASSNTQCLINIQ